MRCIAVNQNAHYHENTTTFEDLFLNYANDTRFDYIVDEGNIDY